MDLTKVQKARDFEDTTTTYNKTPSHSDLPLFSWLLFVNGS